MIGELTLPRLGETMETGRVLAWLKQPGDSFRRGETLVEIETDKTVVEMPALSDGTLAEIVIAAGQDADVGAILCRYEDGVEEAASPVPAEAAGKVAEPEKAADAAAAKPAAEPDPSGDAAPAGAGLRATPLARRVARQHEVDLASLAGSGRRGRIEAADVRGSLQAGRPAAAADLQSLAVTGGTIAYRSWTASAGVRPRVVLLHGIAGDWQGWAGLAAILARSGRHVIAPDLPGHGGTGVEAPDLGTIVTATAEFLKGLGGEPVDLVGHSLGGAVAARVARQASSKVSRLTLLAPVGLDWEIDVGFIRDIVRVRSTGALQHLLRRLVVRPVGLTPPQLDALVAELSRGRLAALSEQLVDAGGQQVDITGDLRGLSMPVRVVWGVQDRIIPWTQVSQLGSRTSIHLIQDAGHVAHWDQPTEVAGLFD